MALLLGGFIGGIAFGSAITLIGYNVSKKLTTTVQNETDREIKCTVNGGQILYIKSKTPPMEVSAYFTYKLTLEAEWSDKPDENEKQDKPVKNKKHDKPMKAVANFYKDDEHIFIAKKALNGELMLITAKNWETPEKDSDKKIN